MSHRNKNLPSGFDPRHHSTRHPSHIQLCQSTSEDLRVRHFEYASLQLRILATPFGFQPTGFLLKIHTQHLRQQLDKKYHPDDSEGIGNTVCNRSQRRIRTVNGHGKSWCTGQRTGYQPYHTGSIDTKSIFQSYGRQRSRSHYQHSNQNQRLALRAKRIKETGTRLDTYGKDEQHQSEVAQFFWNRNPEMPEEQSNENNSRHIKGNSANFNTPQHKPQGHNEKQGKIRRIQ